jgi:hypothetical protein
MGYGSYSVKVIGGASTGLMCGKWSTAITIGGVAVKKFATVISPAAAAAAYSYIEGGAQSAAGTLFGAVGSVVLQLMDSFGCTAAGASDAADISATFTGRGFHSFTPQLNLSAFYGIGGARRGCVARVKGMF